MMKTVLFFITFCSLLLFTSNSYAFEFAGMKGRGDGPPTTGGKPGDVAWPDSFIKEVEAAQAQATLEASKYDNWYIDRRVTGNIYEPLSNRKQKPRQVFWGEDRLVPPDIKCNNSDADRILFYTEHLDRSFQHQEKSFFGDKTLIGEFVAIIMGVGWNCDGKTGEKYWVDPGEQDFYASDDKYIKEFIEKSKKVKPVQLDLDEGENYYLDLSNGKYWEKYAAPRRKYVMENCLCEDKPNEGSKK